MTAAPVAQAYELTVEGDVCTITYTPADTLLLEQAINESDEQIASSLLADLPGVSMDDLSLLVNHVGQNLLFSEDLTVASFADSPAAETAARVNAAAVAAGFHENEIFTSLQLLRGVFFALIFMWVYMPSEDGDYVVEPVVYTKDEAREALVGMATTGLFDEAISDASEPGVRHIERTMEMLENSTMIFRAPLLECVGEDPATPVDPGPGDEVPTPGGDNRGGSLSSFGSS
ncbi:hypothetical protein [Corynebacterium gallinarum]|uniref:hypothetical protein n=1 Tax=Corynebacterium gallinarum TaxID=2762214 RepID=UPI001CD84124|nr:hypothetical protein [Corynebacterium gallinarum]